MKPCPLSVLLRLVLAVFAVLCLLAPAYAQDAASPKFTLFAGAGTSVEQGHAKGEIQAGGSIDEAPPDAWGGVSFEGGYLGPWSNAKAGSGFFSADYMASWALLPSKPAPKPSSNGRPVWVDRAWKLFPFVSSGYTRFFGTGNAINFGGGVDYRLNNNHAIRFEVRDYYSFSSPGEHNVALRIGLVTYITD